MSERSLADRIRAEANISARPGQLEALEAIADEVARLEASQRPLLGYAAIARTSTDRLLAYSRVQSTVDAVREWGLGKKIVIAELREVQP